MIDWTPEMIGYLRTLWAGDLSTNGIAGAMNQRFRAELTKNAIVGKAHRMNLPVRPQSPGLKEATASAKRALDRRKAGLEAPRQRPLSGKPKPRKQPPKLVKAPPAPTPTRPNDAGKCCWPMWGFHERPGLHPRFCTAPCPLGTPYCDEHHAVAYVKLGTRRVDDDDQQREAA